MTKYKIRATERIFSKKTGPKYVYNKSIEASDIRTALKQGENEWRNLYENKWKEETKNKVCSATDITVTAIPQ